MANLEMRGMPDHYPERGDQVEAWLIDFKVRHSMGLDMYDGLIEEYQHAADEMSSLEEVVNGREEIKTGAPKKKLKKPAPKPIFDVIRDSEEDED
jgi:hypothetical protein